MCWKNVPTWNYIGNKYNTSAIIRIYHLEVGRLVHIFHNFPRFSREVLSTSRSSLGHRVVIYEKIQGFFFPTRLYLDFEEESILIRFIPPSSWLAELAGVFMHACRGLFLYVTFARASNFRNPSGCLQK